MQKYKTQPLQTILIKFIATLIADYRLMPIFISAPQARPDQKKK
jgi:hypothetical protein